VAQKLELLQSIIRETNTQKNSQINEIKETSKLMNRNTIKIIFASSRGT